MLILLYTIFLFLFFEVYVSLETQWLESLNDSNEWHFLPIANIIFINFIAVEIAIYI